MKKLLYFSFLFLISCTKRTIEKDGGGREVLEARNADKTQLERIKFSP